MYLFMTFIFSIICVVLVIFLHHYTLQNIPQKCVYDELLYNYLPFGTQTLVNASPNISGKAMCKL